ncbi:MULTISPECIES: hypothetical protein [Mesonia]|uniref:Uncharacterized protein n=1 Tax=Mesonia oceanica TaxID=2687242 RepID=A0AC61Y3D1_9FLAO|nr:MULTISPECIES: hypothetical protein [Mesonia]MAN26346.1 hypothetical protein [Mesonia sp.]MBJ97481.1 hypothetical protein [Flavobacteriaceae bacterium]VVU98955.1 hypothetical protein FVB9532_00204 [Mesonia oceanica]
MKLLAFTFLLLFVTFLVTPTVITLIKQDADISCAFSYNEEEQHRLYAKKRMDEFQFRMTSDLELNSFLSEEKTIPISDYSVNCLPVIYYDLLSPPPELA